MFEVEEGDDGEDVCEIVGGEMSVPEWGEVRLEVADWPDLFPDYEAQSRFPFWPVAACPYLVCVTLAQCLKQSDRTRPAPHQAYAVLAPAAPAETSAAPQCPPVSARCPLRVSRGARAAAAGVVVLSLGLRDLDVDGAADVDGAGDVDGRSEGVLDRSSDP